MTTLRFSKKLFERRTDKDFSDDGQRFRFYYYKGILPISTTSYKENTYTDIRLDYLGIPYSEYKEDYDIIDKFNGVEKTYLIENMDKFIENCEYCINKYCK